MKTQLLCTFTQKENLNDILDLIILCNDILYDKIYVFQNGKDHNQLICTYNGEYDGDNHPEDIPILYHYIERNKATHYTQSMLLTKLSEN